MALAAYRNIHKASGWLFVIGLVAFVIAYAAVELRFIALAKVAYVTVFTCIALGFVCVAVGMVVSFLPAIRGGIKWMSQVPGKSKAATTNKKP